MPYRRLRWSMLALVPIILIAFWPGYFGDLAGATFPLHAHAVTASAWLALLGFQLWTIHRRRPRLHAATGRALFALVPLFAAAGVLALHSMAGKMVAGHPFYAVMGARLAMIDVISLAVFVALVSRAIAVRRNMAAHGAAMIATMLLVLPPALGRIVPMAVSLPGALGGFEIAVHVGQAFAVVAALALYRAAPRGGGAFLWVAAICAGQSVLFATIARADAWRAAVARFAALPAAPLTAGAALATLALLWASWRRTGPRRPARLDQAATGAFSVEAA